MGLEGLKAVLAKYETNPEKANGFSSGGYSIDYDKIWRGHTVIGYVNDKKDANNPEIPDFLPTSKTSREEGDCFVASKATAPPDLASPPMSITSPEGAASEEKPSAPGGAPPPSELPGEASSPPPEGEAKDLGSLGAEMGAQPPGQEENPESFSSRRKQPEVDPLGLAQEKGPTRESLEILSSARLEETRRKYFRATAALEFDIEAKGVTGGESVCLYLLPTIRSEGKYELYDFTITKTSSIPSAYAVRQAVASSVAEAIPHVTVNRSQLEMISRRVYSAMRAAKDIAGGKEIEESVEKEIEEFLEEDWRKTALAGVAGLGLGIGAMSGSHHPQTPSAPTSQVQQAPNQKASSDSYRRGQECAQRLLRDFAPDPERRQGAGLVARSSFHKFLRREIAKLGNVSDPEAFMRGADLMPGILGVSVAEDDIGQSESVETEIEQFLAETEES